MTSASSADDLSPSSPWPSKVDLFGIGISCTNYDEITDVIISAAERGDSFVADFLSVDPVVQAVSSSELRQAINGFEIVCPDGHPVRVAMNHLRGTQLSDRVCGPDTSMRVLQRAAERKIPVYFYGSTDEVLQKVSDRLHELFPEIVIAGVYSPPFRPLTDEEVDSVADRINASGARLVFVGLGAPRQSFFARDFRDRIHAGLLCVGAAFDFIAQTKSRAPRWMQRSGVEWLYRLCQEPRRLGKRYLVRNAVFVSLYLRDRFRSIVPLRS